MKQIISLEGITKKYNNKIVLDNINLSFYDNQSTAIIGANGTGKSTLLKIIAGLLPVDKGKRISHLSRNININYVPERFPKLRMNPREYLFYMGSIQEIEKSNLKKRIEAYLEIFHISENMRKTWINQLSKGSIQKIAVIQALLKTPDVLILDEPISGQDIKSQDVFIRLMKRFKSENVVIIFSCHEEYLIDKLADRVLTIDNNRIKSDVLTNINENINDSGVLDYNLSYNKQIWQNRYYDVLIINPLNKSTIQYIREYRGVIKIEKKNEYMIVYINRECASGMIKMIIDLNEKIFTINPSVSAGIIKQNS